MMRHEWNDSGLDYAVYLISSACAGGVFVGTVEAIRDYQALAASLRGAALGALVAQLFVFGLKLAKSRS